MLTDTQTIQHDDDTSSKVKTFIKTIWNLAKFSFTEQLYLPLQNMSLSIKYYWYTLRSQINGAPNKQEGWKVHWNIISRRIGIDAEGGPSCLFWSQWCKCIKNCLWTNQVVIYGKTEAMSEQIFQIENYDLVN